MCLKRGGWSKNAKPASRSGRPDPSGAKPVIGVAAEALTRWRDALAAGGVTSGPLFRALTNGRLGDGQYTILCLTVSAAAFLQLRLTFATDAPRQVVDSTLRAYLSLADARALN